MRVKFISLKEPAKYGYIYDSEAWDTSSRFAICRHFQQCETYGDVHENGNYTQHSGEWVVQAEHLADYLASIASYIIAYPGEETDGLICHFSGDIMRSPSVESIEFAASVKFKPKSDTEPWEKHRRYFSMEEKKISSARIEAAR